MPRFKDPIDDAEDGESWKHGSAEAFDPIDPDDSDMDDNDDPALVPCPYCRAEISENAERCPVCGDYISEETSPRRARLWIVIVTIVLLIVVVMWQLR